MVMRKAILATSLLAMAGCSASPSGPASLTAAVAVSVGGPSAQQLARGRWLTMPAAPIRLCDPLSVWDGHDLVVVEPGWPHCRAAAATYNPRTNSWAAIAEPPKLWARSRLFGPQPVAAWGDGRLVMVSPVTGVTVAWSPATGRWQQIRTLPSRGAVSASWTGSKFLVITARMIAVNKGTARAFALTGDRWTRLPDLPQPGKGQIVEAVTAADDGAVYALAGINVAHTSPNDMYNSGHVELLRLTPAAWTPVPLSSSAPSSQLALTQVDGAIVAAGSACLGRGGCTEEDGAAALLRPGSHPATIALRPQPGVPYPRDIASGRHAIVVTYPEGLGDTRPGPPPAITTGRWLQGPTATDFRADLGAYWTPYGVVSLGQPSRAAGVESTHIGGWLLRPAR
jgi:hypothetical protein